jgi:hypothetical protein
MTAVMRKAAHVVHLDRPNGSYRICCLPHKFAVQPAVANCRAAALEILSAPSQLTAVTSVPPSDGRRPPGWHDSCGARPSCW